MISRLSMLAICVIPLFAVASPAEQNSSAQGQRQSCPTISVSCPVERKDNEPLTFTANVRGGNPNVVPIYDWTVSAGKVVHGQGSPSIRVDRVEYGGNSFTATVSIAGFDLACPSTASCSLIIEHLPPSIKFDSFGTLLRNKEVTRLNAFTVQLQNQPGTQGYLLVYGGRRERASKAQRAATRSKDYLVKTRGLDASRIVTVDAGLKEALTIELWVVPAGSVPPAAAPTFGPGEVKLVRRRKKGTAKRHVKL